MSLKISIIYGSTRDGRLGIRFAKYLTKEFINRDIEAVLIDPLNMIDPGNPENWSAIDTNPEAESNGFIGNPERDNDLDGLNALVEYAIGTSDQSYNNSPPLAVNFDSNSIQLTHTIDKSAADVQLIIETTANLEEWVQIQTLGEIDIKETNIGDGIVNRTITVTNQNKSTLTRHFRIKVVK